MFQKIWQIYADSILKYGSDLTLSQSQNITRKKNFLSAMRTTLKMLLSLPKSLGNNEWELITGRTTVEQYSYKTVQMKHNAR